MEDTVRWHCILLKSVPNKFTSRQEASTCLRRFFIRVHLGKWCSSRLPTFTSSILTAVGFRKSSKPTSKNSVIIAAYASARHSFFHSLFLMSLSLLSKRQSREFRRTLKRIFCTRFVFSFITQNFCLP